MRGRIALLAAGLTMACFASPSIAAAPSCNLMTDVKGDATDIAVGVDVGPNSPSLDILSADIATDAKNLTAVLRVDKLSTSDSTSPLGQTWYVYFTGSGPELYVTALLTPTGESYSAGYTDTTRMSLGAATGIIDVDKNEIRITAPLSLFDAQSPIKKGSKLTGLNALTQRYVGVSAAGNSRGATLTADTADGGKNYVAGAPSCVVVGK